MEFIWEELGPKFRDLLEMGKSGVIASLIVASQRLHTREHEVYYSNTISCLTFLLKF
jgi:nucleolar protein 9